MWAGCGGFSSEYRVGRDADDRPRQYGLRPCWIWWTILTPTLGGLAAGLAIYYVVPGAAGSGIPQVKAAFSLRSGLVPIKDAIGKFILCSVQIGSGASLGSLCAGSLFCSDEAAAADFHHCGSEIGRKKTSSTRLFGLWRPIPGLQRHYAPSRTNRLRC
jgi:hypothetical protein